MSAPRWPSATSRRAMKKVSRSSEPALVWSAMDQMSRSCERETRDARERKATAAAPPMGVPSGDASFQSSEYLSSSATLRRRYCWASVGRGERRSRGQKNNQIHGREGKQRRATRAQTRCQQPLIIATLPHQLASISRALSSTSALASPLRTMRRWPVGRRCHVQPVGAHLRTHLRAHWRRAAAAPIPAAVRGSDTVAAGRRPLRGGTHHAPAGIHATAAKATRLPVHGARGRGDGTTASGDDQGSAWRRRRMGCMSSAAPLPSGS